MKRFVFYLSIAAASFLIFVVVLAPASIPWRLIEDDVHARVPDLAVTDVRGSIWDGSARLTYRSFPTSTFEWDVTPASFLTGTVRADARLNGDGLAVSGPAAVSTQQLAASLAGSVASDYINPHSTRFGLRFPGTLEIENLSIKAGRQWFTGATGKFYWTGGTVTYQTYEGPQAVQLPPLEGRLSMGGEDLILNVTNDRAALIDIALSPSGWARVELKARLFELADLPWPAEADPDTALLVLEEKLF